MTKSDEWKGTKSQRETLRQMFGGRCGYCGEHMVRMQADHIVPVVRLTMDVGGRPLPASERRMLQPHLNVVSNMMPSCVPCNNSKGGRSLENWRSLIARSHEIVAREKPIFNAGVRFGVIIITGNDVVFHFERTAQADAITNKMREATR